MNFAKEKDLDRVYKMFMLYKEIFPHIRKDYLERYIKKGEVILQKGVVIVFHRYIKGVHLGTAYISKGHYILHQIVANIPGNGNAGMVLSKFIKYTDAPIWLTVRKDNERAIRFYEKHGFREVGTIQWADDTIPGVVMNRDYPSEYW